MQMLDRISLNAIRVFALVAKHDSISLAADELCVTASAVSHQIKNLETHLGISLFVRKNNSIRLTDTGLSFLADVTPGLVILNQATEKLFRDSNEVVVRVSVTFAVRWLIPSLERFKQRYPTAKIRLETSGFADVSLDPFSDIAITYRQKGDYQDKEDTLLTDYCCPVLSPDLLAQSGYGKSKDIIHLPALKCTENNWDWGAWCTEVGIDQTTIDFADQFDIDDAALRAAVAGLGMVLSSDFMIKSEVENKTLVKLPGFEAVELGRYCLQQGARKDGMVEKFKNWLFEEMAIVSQG